MQKRKGCYAVGGHDCPILDDRVLPVADLRSPTVLGAGGALAAKETPAPPGGSSPPTRVLARYDFNSASAPDGRNPEGGSHRRGPRPRGPSCAEYCNNEVLKSVVGLCWELCIVDHFLDGVMINLAGNAWLVQDQVPAPHLRLCNVLGRKCYCHWGVAGATTCGHSRPADASSFLDELG